MLHRILTACFVLCAAAAFAQTQLTDFRNPDGADYSYPGRFTEFNNQLFFTASNDKTGYELWKTDGTAEGSVMIKDINLGSGSSISSNLQVFKGKLYFIATDGVYGYQLWESNGTADGTKRITTVLQYPVNEIVATSSHLFFLRPGGDLQVWKSDGTADGTSIVKGDIDLWNQPSNLTVAMGLVFFTSQPEGSNDTRVWRSDGTYAGTFPITGLIDGDGSHMGGSSHPTRFIEFNGALYFVCRDFNHYPSVGIMKTDGTVAGTQWVEGVHSGSTLIEQGDVIVHDGKMYFSFYELDANHFFIWSSQGTEASTQLAYDHYSSTYFSPSMLTSSQGKLWFTTGNNSGGVMLTKFDPVTRESNNVVELAQPERPFIFIYFVDVNTITPIGSKMVITVSTDNIPHEMWVSDGSAAGSQKLSASTDEDKPVLFGNQLYFNGHVEDSNDELYRSDGTVSGTGMVKDLAPSAQGLSLSSGLYKTGSNAIFVAYDKEHGVELWKSDGTKSGTGLLKDLLPGNYSSYPRDVQIIGGKAYFVAYTTDGQELFETDGTADGTKMLTDFIASQKSVTDILPLDDNRCFLVVKNGDDSNSLDLYTVATAAKQELVNFGFNDYHYPFRPTLSVTTGDNLYFITEGVGSEFWKSDGTAAGTKKVDAFRQITEMIAAGDKIFCIDQEYPSEQRFLKQTDGSAGGAMTLKEVNKNLGSYALFAYGNKVVFEDQDASNGREIWISDGTASNTKLLKDVNEGPLSSFENTQFCVYNDGLYFTATNTTDGSELWKTDGTTAGTTMVADILLGPGDSKPYSLASTGGRLYFTAYTPQTGFEVWSTDGTSNTKLEMDVNRGPTYSNPRGYMDLNGTLLFFATTESSGVQLWSSAINTGIAEAGANTLSVYPNPSAGTFNVSLRNLDGASLAVFNTAGQRVHTQEAATGLSQVDLGNLPSGLYVLQCTKGNKQYTTKVIKTN